MGLVTLIQGFRLGVSEFDDFLIANRLPPMGGGYQPSRKEAEDISKLFRAKGINCEVKIFVPYVTGFDRSHHLFVCCDWIHVLAAREIKDVLQKPVPPAFEEMRKSLRVKSGVSTYVVYNDEDTSSYPPEEIIRRNKAPIQCGVCDASFSLWHDRMRHREEHEISEEYNPLPDC